MAAGASIERLIEQLHAAGRLRVAGGGSKGPLSRPGDGESGLDLGTLSGIVQYDPSEYTVTVLAGTPVVELEAALAEHGQYLPFEPLLAEAGATLGGTVAAAANGPGRVRYGGVRDFLLAVRFLDGEGRLLSGGAPVVKNAAGFDLPKLMVGSLGALGVLIELTFKVFPRPPASRTLELSGERAAVLGAFARAVAAGRDLDGLEAQLDGGGARLWLRVAGEAEALPSLARRWRQTLIGEQVDLEVREIGDDAEPWRRARELAWAPPRTTVVRLPATPGRLSRLDDRIAEQGWLRRWAGGGQQLLVAIPEAEEEVLDRQLAGDGLCGLPLAGPSRRRRFGSPSSSPLLSRILPVLDPRGVLSAGPGAPAV